MPLTSYKNSCWALQQISIYGKPVCTLGILDVSSGVIKGTVVERYEYVCNVNIRQDGWQEDLPTFFCIPFISSGSDVTVTFKIDGEDYSCRLSKYRVAGGMKSRNRFTPILKEELVSRVTITT